MRKLLTICAILLSLSVTAQWQLTGSKVRYVNGIGIPTKDTAAGVLADSSQILIRPADSSLYIKYKRTWQKVGAGGTVGGSGTTNYVPKFTSSTAIGNSQIFDNGTNVGINTTSPGAKLDVYGGATGTVTNIQVGNASTALLVGVDGANNPQIRTAQSVPILFYNAGLERMRIDASGNVGIGYTAPAAKLAVSGTALINTNTDNGVDKLQVSGSAIASTLKFNTSGQTVSISSYYNGGTGRNIWIGGGGTSSNSSAWGNVSLGDAALNAVTSGFFNVGIGGSALQALTTGDRNMALGFEAGPGITSGRQNTAMGANALGNLSTGSDNTGIGSGSLANITTPSSNIGIGAQSGAYFTPGVGSNNTTSSQSIYIGNDTRSSANGNSNEIVIGHNAIGQGSNTVTLGNSSITKTFLRGTTLINTTTDNGIDKLIVNGSIDAKGFAQAYTTKTGAYTATTSDYLIDCLSGTFTVTLPDALLNVGRILVIKNSGTGTITVDGNGSQTIDGATTYSLSAQWATVQIMCDGGNWKIISKF